MPLDATWMAVSRFGNSGLMLPAAGIVISWLYLSQSRRDAVRCLVWLIAAVGLVAASKIAFFGWGIGIRSLNLGGLSGHSTLATAVLPVAAYMLLPAGRPAWRWAGCAAGLLAGIVISVSRVVVLAHSPAESAIGCMLGAVVALLVIRSSGVSKTTLSPRWALVPFAALVLLFVYGKRWDVEEIIIKAAVTVSGHEQPVSRATWLAGR